MVKLTEVEDEHFSEKPKTTTDGSLLADDDDDYTDTDSEISEDESTNLPQESLTDRIVALKDMIPPAHRARISYVSNTLYRTTSSGLLYGGKGLWILCTSVLLFGMPYALAFGSEQEMMEEERQRGMMAEGASGMMQSGDSDAKPSI